MPVGGTACAAGSAGPTPVKRATAVNRGPAGLTADPGEWNKDLDDIDYQWELCHEGDDGCDGLPDATGNEYRILPENADHEFRVRVRVVSGDEEVTIRVGPTELVPTPGVP